MAEKWHDIDSPGVWQKPDKKGASSNSGNSKAQDESAVTDTPPQEPKKPLVKLSEGKFVPPAEGAVINKKCPAQVNVEFLDDSAKPMKKVTFSLYANLFSKKAITMKTVLPLTISLNQEIHSNQTML